MAAKKKSTATAKGAASVDDMIANDTTAQPALSPDLLHRITGSAHALREARETLARAEAAVEEAKGRVRELRERVLPALLDEAQLRAVTLQDEEGTMVERGEDVYASISKEKAPAACAWLDAHGYGALIKSEVAVTTPRGDRKTATRVMALLRKAGVAFEERSGVHPQTLKAFVRESLEAGRALSPDITYHTVPVAELRVKKVRRKRVTPLPDDAQFPEF